LGTKEPNTKTVEVKCLNSASHIEAYITQTIPDEYRYQIIQYYAVADQLEALDMIFFDPRMAVKDFFILKTKRSDFEAEIQFCLEYQIKELAEIERNY